MIDYLSISEIISELEIKKMNFSIFDSFQQRIMNRGRTNKNELINEKMKWENEIEKMK